MNSLEGEDLIGARRAYIAREVHLRHTARGELKDQLVGPNSLKWDRNRGLRVLRQSSNLGE